MSPFWNPFVSNSTGEGPQRTDGSHHNGWYATNRNQSENRSNNNHWQSNLIPRPPATAAPNPRTDNKLLIRNVPSRMSLLRFTAETYEKSNEQDHLLPPSITVITDTTKYSNVQSGTMLRLGKIIRKPPLRLLFPGEAVPFNVYFHDGCGAFIYSVYLYHLSDIWS